MNDVRMLVKAVNLALKTVRITDAVKKATIMAATAVCTYVIYRTFTDSKEQ